MPGGDGEHPELVLGPGAPGPVQAHRQRGRLGRLLGKGQPRSARGRCPAARALSAVSFHVQPRGPSWHLVLQMGTPRLRGVAFSGSATCSTRSHLFQGPLGPVWLPFRGPRSPWPAVEGSLQVLLTQTRWGSASSSKSKCSPTSLGQAGRGGVGKRTPGGHCPGPAWCLLSARLCKGRNECCRFLQEWEDQPRSEQGLAAFTVGQGREGPLSALGSRPGACHSRGLS